MTTNTAPYRPGRVVMAAASLLLVPLAAELLTDEMAWSPADYVAAAVMLIGTALAYELIVRRAAHVAYRAGAALGLGGALLLLWINLAVGIIGSEDNRANAMYLGVLIVGFLGTVLSRFEARGMARAMYATGLAQAAVAGIAVVQQLDPRVMQILTLNFFFVALFGGAGSLFQHAAREQRGAGAPSAR
jgi:hypothetical protein